MKDLISKVCDSSEDLERARRQLYPQDLEDFIEIDVVPAGDQNRFLVIKALKDCIAFTGDWNSNDIEELPILPRDKVTNRIVKDHPDFINLKEGAYYVVDLEGNEIDPIGYEEDEAKEYMADTLYHMGYFNQ